MKKIVGILCLYLLQIFVGCSVSENVYEKYDLTSLTEKCRNENKYLVIIIGMEDCRFCDFFYHVLRSSGTFEKTITDRFVFSKVDIREQFRLAQILGISSTPTVLITDAALSVKYVHSGLLAASEWQQVLSEIINGGSVFALQKNDLYSVGKEVYALYSKVLQAHLLLDKLSVSGKEYREAIRLLEESIHMEPYFMNRYLLMSAYIAVGEKARGDSLYYLLASGQPAYEQMLYGNLVGFVPEKKYVDVTEDKKAVFYTISDVLDLGEIKKGKTTEVVVKFTNRGDTPLIITNVDASCGCIRSEWDRKPVLKNEEGQIKLSYYTDNQGYLSKRVMIFSNGVKSPVAITLKGTIK